MAGTDLSAFENHPRAQYGGVVARESVHALIARHDALVFPSYHVGEGLPGVVVEALQCGRPVIASTWRALPEIVEHERSGLLVAPMSVDALARAMSRLNRDGALYARVCRGALSRGREYVAAPWHEKLEGWLADLAAGRAPAPQTFERVSRRVAIEEHAR
jgi:glycosyltransferase involved in cell wall biosynthesis